jgi:hypothetical protein
MTDYSFFVHSFINHDTCSYFNFAFGQSLAIYLHCGRYTFEFCVSAAISGLLGLGFNDFNVLSLVYE